MYEMEEREWTIVKAVWGTHVNGVADCAGRIMSEVIGVRWLLGEK